MIIILFGLAGSGKNFVGDIIQAKFGFHYWDADQALTPLMRDYIKIKKNFTPAMVDEYCEIIIAKVNELKELHPNLVVSQALYRNENRFQIMRGVANVRFCQVEAPDDLVEERLVKRNNGVDREYVASFRHFFQQPNFIHWKIDNSMGDAFVEQQFKKILKDMDDPYGLSPGHAEPEYRSSFKIR